MNEVQYTFKRYEKKFLLTPEQYGALISVLRDTVTEDDYGVHTICNVYYDTENYDLIRASLDKPVYKEKFRLRSYGVPSGHDRIFVEIKKKYRGVVYKRRVDAPSGEVAAFVTEGKRLSGDVQIQREIQWFLRQYQPKPKVFLAYERIAFLGKGDAGLRITFDCGLRYRTERLNLCAGDDGECVLPEDSIVMEVKTPVAVPLWLASLLSERQIYPVSFSKYGMCYERCLLPHSNEKGRVLCV